MCPPSRVRPLWTARIVFCFLVLAAPVLLFVVLPEVSLNSIADSISYSLSKKLYHVQEPGLVLDTSSASDMIVRSVYFDDRPRNGRKNAIVFLVEVRKTVLTRGRIVACEVGDQLSTQVKVHLININGWVGNYVDEKPFLSHTMALVDCYDIPSQKNGSSASLHYKRIDSARAMVVPAVSLRPLLYFPPSPPLETTTRDNTSHSYRVAACIGVVYGNPHSQLVNWLHYQQTIGVEYVHMIADESFERSGGLRQSYVKKALDDGFLTIDVWKAHLRTNVEIQYHSQMLAYHDCIYQFRNRYEYMIFTDQDDFFVPLVPGKRTLHHYIDNWCYKGSCSFDWIEYYPDCGMKGESAPDGNLTSLLVSHKHKKTPYKKCLHRLSAIVEIGIHDARDVLTGYHAVDVPGNMAYVAHVRQSRRPPGGTCQ